MRISISPTRSTNAVSWRIASQGGCARSSPRRRPTSAIVGPSYDLQGMMVSGTQRPGGNTGASERRPITVLFADIAGSTAIAERLDPEDWTAIVGEAFQRMNRTVERYRRT